MEDIQKLKHELDKQAEGKFVHRVECIARADSGNLTYRLWVYAPSFSNDRPVNNLGMIKGDSIQELLTKLPAFLKKHA